MGRQDQHSATWHRWYRVGQVIGAALLLPIVACCGCGAMFN